MTPPPVRPRVLLVDDDATFRLLTGAALEREGFVVECAEDGALAIQRLEDGGIDCVILDVVMPGMSGFDVCTAIRAAPWGPFLPVLMLTSLEDLEATERAFDVGASDFAPKTLNALLIARRVHFLLRAKATADSLRSSELKLRRAQQIARFGHWEWQPDATRSDVSEAVLDILGLESGADVDFARFCELVPESDRPALQAAVAGALASGGRYSIDHGVVQPGGRTRIVHHEGVVSRSGLAGSGTVVLSILHDITEQRRAEERLVFLAYHDEVTGLANRLRCLEFLADGMRREGAGQASGVVAAVMELHGFRRIANTLGDRRGNELLRAVAGRLAEVLRMPNDAGGEWVLAWLGGEKFALAAVGLANVESIVPMVRRLQAAVTQPFAIAGTEVHFGAPVGIATAGEVAGDADALLINASTAMLHSRRNGPQACMFFAEPMHATAARRLALESDLRRGIPRDELWVAYQPRVALDGMRLVGVEALARWTHPWQGVIRPDEFIGIAEQSGLIRDIGSQILRRACSEAAGWQSRLPGVMVSVNVSGAQLRDVDFLGELDAALTASALDPRLLELEITETLLVENSETATRVLAALRARGIRIALDDFGTGYSALAYLRRFPIDVVKIDRSFVRDLLTSADAASLVQAIVTLTHSIGLHSVAEGVETVEQSRTLGRYGCDEGQGYYFCRPQPLAGFLAWAENWTGEAGDTGARRALALQAG